MILTVHSRLACVFHSNVKFLLFQIASKNHAL